jgi:hypothetical protein
MHTTDALAVTPDLRVAVAIDLIGDLDATLGVIFSDALSHLVDQGTTDVLLMTRHVSVTSLEGITAIDGALGAARAKGCSILVEPGSRRMKAAFAAAHVSVATAKEERRRSARHVMIARHAAQPSLKHTA